MSTDGIEVFDGDGVVTTSPGVLPGQFATSPSVAAVKAILGVDAMTPLVTPKGRRVSYPWPSARPGQLEGIDRIYDTLQTGSDVLFCAGTGFGKSPALIGTASMFDSAWMIVGRNDLVEQWRRDYEHFTDMGFMKARNLFECPSLKGRNDEKGQPYNCKTGKARCGAVRKWVSEILAYNEPIDQTVPDGFALETIPDGILLEPQAAQVLKANLSHDNRVKASVVKQVASAWAHANACPYEANRDAALQARFTVMTASMALTLFTYLEHRMGKRALLVVDECSELEDELIRFYEVQLRAKWVNQALGGSKATIDTLADGQNDELFQRYKPGTFIKDVIRSIRPSTSVPTVVAWCDELKRLLNRRKNRLSDDATDEREEIEDAISRIETARSGIDAGVPYHVELEDDGDVGDYKVKLSPLEARGLFDRTLGKFADRFVFTSATTGTAQLFRDTHALARRVAYVEAGTPFPAGNRPILYQPVGNLAKKTFDTDITKVCEAVVQIAGRSGTGQVHYDHAKQKGLIHTFTNRVTDQVVAAFDRAGQRHRVLVLGGSGYQRTEIFRRFKASADPLILVSPSAMLGISLDDDLGRWQVVVKTPYAFLGDPAVVHRKDTIPGWYSWQTTKDLIQAFGRIVRSPTDWGITYLLDSSFGNHLRYNRDQFPAYVLEALHEIPP